MALAADPEIDLQTLERVQRRVLWLATAIVHHANRVRENRSGVKVGGHQASSASMVSLMTALWFSELRAEDGGAVWGAIADPWVARLGEVLWVVDLNRQSLDRVVPDIAFGRLAGMFEAAGWQVLTVKYGRRLEALFERGGGEDLRRRIDEMPNEEYQRLLRADPAELRERLPGRNAGLAGLVGELRDDELRAAFRDLGGHDIGKLIDAYGV